MPRIKGIAMLISQTQCQVILIKKRKSNVEDLYNVSCIKVNLVD